MQKEKDLLEELKGYNDGDEAFLISCSYILELTKHAQELFRRSQPDQKNRLIRFVFANATVQGEKLDYKLKKLFEGIVECNKMKKWYSLLDALRTFDWGKLRTDMNTIKAILTLSPQAFLPTVRPLCTS
ncbi:MAG: hypothetical protein PHZ00_05655 [Candidatus Peribacteraceae bacterium]|nr:hypothetical protein [Candidatus Peribacteraceae bacterium]